MYIRYGIRTDRGKVRESNEDSYAADPASKLFLVADGMGGHAAGEIASSMAAAAVEEYLAQPRDGTHRPAEVLLAALAEANARIYRLQKEKAECAGMGSTLTALSLGGRGYCVAHVGDSRAYIMRKDRLRQLTRDHSLVWPLYENGVITKSELSSHPQKNLITRSIGPHPQVDVDIGEGELQESDIFLLCSDGLTDVVPDEAIADVLAQAKLSPEEMSRMLVDAANRAGGPDNVTVLVIRVEAGEEPGGESVRTESR